LPDYEATQVQRVFIATSRADQSGTLDFGAGRGLEMRYGRLDVSIPIAHTPGELTWPRRSINPEKHFVAIEAARYTSTPAFLKAVASNDPTGNDETILYVHGYNENLAESSYRLSQVAWDYQIPAPVVAFSWPSAAVPGGYVYDRDSVIFARDDLERLLVDLTKDGRRVFIMAHSMGSQLVMEVLRQISIGNSMDLARISGVALVQPDIDEEVFERQAERIDPLPQPFAIFVAETDVALRISAWLTGRIRRLGSIRDPEKLGDLPVVVFDLTDLAEPGELNHSILFNSPVAIEKLSALIGDGPPPDVEETRRVVFSR